MFHICQNLIAPSLPLTFRSRAATLCIECPTLTCFHLIVQVQTQSGLQRKSTWSPDLQLIPDECLIPVSLQFLKAKPAAQIQLEVQSFEVCGVELVWLLFSCIKIGSDLI